VHNRYMCNINLYNGAAPRSGVKARGPTYSRETTPRSSQRSELCSYPSSAGLEFSLFILLLLSVRRRAQKELTGDICAAERGDLVE
jgi:hypothetical protein